jgi:hypothetical protein
LACTVQVVKLPSRFSWLQDLRVVLFAIGCAIAGFLIATFIFGAPWHLPPAWGDIPTWLAFIAASVAGSAALIQLSQQQKQITEEAARNVERDKLLRTQLAEAAERMNAIRRQQAEHVILDGFSITREIDGDGRIGRCEVTNGSGRPIRNISCRMPLEGNLITPSEFQLVEELHPVLGTPGPGTGFTYVPAIEGTFDLGAGKYFHLLDNQIVRAVFPMGNDGSEQAQYIIRFTDDAEVRWQLDSDMRLSPPPDTSW